MSRGFDAFLAFNSHGAEQHHSVRMSVADLTNCVHMNMNNITQRESRPVAIITGASSGIGQAFARRLAGQGYHVVLVARRTELLEDLVREISSTGSAEMMVADLTDPAAVARVEDRIGGESHLELLVNNAGVRSNGHFAETDLQTHEAMLTLHITATMRLTHAALRAMKGHRGGIINVSSSAASRPSAGEVVYCSTKAWVNSFTEALALELQASAPHIRLQALCPGHTLTDFHGPAPSRYLRYVALKPAEVVTASLEALDRDQVIAVPTCRRHRLMLILAKIASVTPRLIRERLLRVILGGATASTRAPD